MAVYELKPADLDKEATLKHKETYGGYNDPPPNWKRITEEQFAKSDYFTYGFVRSEYRQFVNPEKDELDSKYQGMISVQLLYMHAGHGYAIHNDWMNDRICYYRFGCEHKYVGLDQQECRRRNIPHYGRCYHVSECSICGHIYSCDSSD